MARAKGAGKKKSRKPAAKKTAPAAAKAPAQQYPCNAIVNKGAEKIPVQVKDAAQHAQLKTEFGEAQVEVAQ